MTWPFSDQLRPTPQRETRTRLIWWLIGAFVVIVVSPLAMLATIRARLHFQQARAAAAIDAEKSRLRAAGEPISTAELLAWQETAGGTEDATSAWLAAIRSIDTEQFQYDGLGLPYIGRGKLSMLERGRDDNQLPAAKELLATYQTVIQSSFAAARHKGRILLPIDIEGEDAPLPLSAEFRCLADLLRLNAHVHAVDGDSAVAAESLIALVSLAAALDNQPTLSRLAPQQLILFFALMHTELLLSTVQFDGEPLVRLQEAIQPFDPAASLARALIGQRALTVDWLPEQPHTSALTVNAILQLLSQFVSGSAGKQPDKGYLLTTVRQWCRRAPGGDCFLGPLLSTHWTPELCLRKSTFASTWAATPLPWRRLPPDEPFFFSPLALGTPGPGLESGFWRRNIKAGAGP